jgi:spore photoproduct lyase
VGNVILSWSLSNAAYEKGAPPVPSRIAAMKAAVDAGWKVRLCIDPVLALRGWEDDLRNLLALVENIDFCDISAGGFRISSAQYKRMVRLQPGSVASRLPLMEKNGVMLYPPDVEAKIHGIIKEALSS